MHHRVDIKAQAKRLPQDSSLSPSISFLALLEGIKTYIKNSTVLRIYLAIDLYSR